MTRMMKLDNTYRVHLVEVVTREFYVDVLAGDNLEAWDLVEERYLDANEDWKEHELMRDREIEVNEVEKISTSQER